MDSILMVEDREPLRRLYSEFLHKQSYAVTACASAEEALHELKSREFTLVITDYLLPGLNGLALLREIKNQNPEQLVIVITAFGEIKLAVEAIKNGAFDFLEKPIDLEYLRITVSKALELRKLELSEELRRADSEKAAPEIIGTAPALQAALKLVDAVADSQVSCLLLGESGVGKELFARRIHALSPRAEAPLVSVNCAAIPHELLESELFGHEKGAFTGAVLRKSGLIELASGGTLFLDEIGELPLDLQPKLLRFLQEQEFRRVGGVKTLKANVRLICATNRDLIAGARAGWFREDLYHRLAVFPIQIPPLRERLEDLDLIFPWLIQRMRGKPIALEPNLLTKLKRYSWPGNVRELENLVERALLLAKEGPLALHHFPENLLESENGAIFRFQLQLDKGLKANLELLLEEGERALIRTLLKQKMSREQIAQRLEIAPKTLYNRIKALDLDP